jgi:hypothetical protein
VPPQTHTPVGTHERAAAILEEELPRLKCPGGDVDRSAEAELRTTLHTKNRPLGGGQMATDDPGSSSANVSTPSWPRSLSYGKSDKCDWIDMKR